MARGTCTTSASRTRPDRHTCSAKKTAVPAKTENPMSERKQIDSSGFQGQDRNDSMIFFSWLGCSILLGAAARSPAGKAALLN
mmetsp:Transcript_76813/g.193228  ORF Transcript_76813/g.193228 Transcript_76813/m.193228 type:complete len:83 (+) Transcript_76813:253-501(+)